MTNPRNSSIRARFARIAALGVLIPVGVAMASQTASVISLSTGAIGLWHGVISLAAPNPVTPITGLIYGAISVGAGVYDQCVDPPPQGAPTIVSIHAGPPQDRTQDPYEFVLPGPPISSAPAGRILTVRGTNFSMVHGENRVFFDGVESVTGAMSTNQTLVTAIPLSNLGALPRQVSVVIQVGGVPSQPFVLNVQPPPSPGNAATRVRAKLSQLSGLVGNFDWNGLIDIENPGITPEERQCALGGADDMVNGAGDSLDDLGGFQNLLDTNAGFRMAAEQSLAANPEIETLVDDALAGLGGGGVPVMGDTLKSILVLMVVGAGAVIILRRF
ncbi:MAG: IPT/TIG domain-containing protein [Phycisphaerales bacterium]